MEPGRENKLDELREFTIYNFLNVLIEIRICD